ncbi:unnamed protein product, partial [Pylaiella littoralis]
MDAEPTGSECAKCLSNDCLSARRHGLRRESAVAKSVAVQVVLPAAVVDGIGPQKIQNAYLIQVAGIFYMCAAFLWNRCLTLDSRGETWLMRHGHVAQYWFCFLPSVRFG